MQGAGRLPGSEAVPPAPSLKGEPVMAWEIDPKLNPSKTPRKRRGPEARCYCDLPDCAYCRHAAAQRRWYHRNREHTLEQHNEYMREVRALKRTPVSQDLKRAPEPWDDLDRRALEMLRQEGLR